MATAKLTWTAGGLIVGAALGTWFISPLLTDAQASSPQPVPVTPAETNQAASPATSLAGNLTVPNESREALPEAESLADQIGTIDRLVPELITTSTESELSDAERKALDAGLHRNHRRLQEWLRQRSRAAADAQAARMAVLRKLNQQTRKWVGRISQIDDPAARAAALEEVRVALHSDDPDQQLAALNALRSLGDVKIDKAAFQPIVRSIAGTATGPRAVAALYALSVMGRDPADLALVMRLAESPTDETRGASIHLLSLYSDRKLTGATGASVLALLNVEEPAQVRRAIHGVSGAIELSPALEARLLALADSKDRQVRHDSVYFALSTMSKKTRNVVEKLTSLLGNKDRGQSQRALWGLGHGVAKADQPLVLEAVKRFFAARTSTYQRDEVLRLLGRYGTATDKPWLESIIQNPQTGDRTRRSAQAALRAIGSR